MGDRKKPHLHGGAWTGLAPGEDIEAVFVPDSYTRAAMVAGAMAYEEWSVGGVLRREPPVTLLGTAAWNNPELVTLGQRYVRNSAFVDAYFGGDWRNPTADFARRMTELNGSPPTVLEAAAYDSTRILLEVMAASPGHRTGVRQGLAQARSAVSLTGLRSFDASGEALRDMRILSVHGKEIVQVAPALTPAPDEPAP
jgi:hypothetical protein